MTGSPPFPRPRASRSSTTGAGSGCRRRRRSGRSRWASTCRPRTPEPRRREAHNPVRGSIEGRKNHLGLLEACEALWAKGLRFQLHLVGLAHAETGGPALKRLPPSSRPEGPIVYGGAQPTSAPLSRPTGARLHGLSLVFRGFGLPVTESLARDGRCSAALWEPSGRSRAEAAAWTWGTPALRRLPRPSRSLLLSPARLAALSEAARSRRLNSWPEYAAELLEWMQSLGRHA